MAALTPFPARTTPQSARIEAELALYKDAVPLTQACEAIVTHIEKEVEPFGTAKPGPDANQWQAGAAGGGGCIIS